MGHRCFRNRLDLAQGSLQRLAVTDNLTKIDGHVDFVPQVITLLLKQLFETFDLLVCRFALALYLYAL